MFSSGITPKITVEEVLVIVLFKINKLGHFNGIWSFVNFIFLTLSDNLLDLKH